MFTQPSPRTPPPPRGGRTERHGLSSRIATLNAAANSRAKSDGVPGGGGLGARDDDMPTRCVQQRHSRAGGNPCHHAAKARARSFAALAFLALTFAALPAHAVDPGEMLRDPVLE